MIQMRVVLLTSYYWEGAYVLRELIAAGVPCTHVLLQKTWWRDRDGHGYSERYRRLLHAECADGGERTYFDIEELAQGFGVSVCHVDGINCCETVETLSKIDPTLIVVVGGAIIANRVLRRFDERFVNYHTGILPAYRGPYSEFWAIHRNEPHMIGTTIHLINEGIDTGPILAVQAVDVGQVRDPQVAHLINGRAGARLMASTVSAYLAGRIQPVLQVEAEACYYTYPTDEEIDELSRRLAIEFDLRFAD